MMRKIPYGYQIVIEGHDEKQMYELFERIQNRFCFFDNCVIQEIDKEDTILDNDRRSETGELKIRKEKQND